MNYHNREIDDFINEIKTHLLTIDNMGHIQTNCGKEKRRNGRKELSKRNKKANKDKDNQRYRNNTIDNSPIRDMKKRDISFTNWFDTHTPNGKAKKKTRSKSKQRNKTIDYSLTPQKKVKFSIKPKTPNNTANIKTKFNQRTPDIRPKSKNKNKLKPCLNEKALLKKNNSYININTHYKSSKSNATKVNIKQKKTHPQTAKRNIPINYTRHNTPSNSKKVNNNKQIGLKGHQAKVSNPIPIPTNSQINNVDTSVFQSFGKPILHSNNKNNCRDTLKPDDYKLKSLLQRNKSVNSNHQQYNESKRKKETNVKHKYNSSYQLPDENNKIDFINLDQFSPPYALANNYTNTNLKKTSHFNTTYTNYDDDDYHDYRTINPSNNKKMINDFVDRIKINKDMNYNNKQHYYTIDYYHNYHNAKR